MDKKIYNVEIIGFALALLYAVSGLAFWWFFKIPDMSVPTAIFAGLFGSLCVGAVGVMTRREWGRKLLVVLNGILLICLLARFIPRADLLPLGYLFLSFTVLLYFTQTKIKLQFHTGRYDAWHRCILVIDDDETICKFVRPILFNHGFSVLSANTGEDGLQIAKKQKPDLILLDVILPGIKGRDVCVRLKEDPETRNIPVVFLTAKNSPEDLRAEEEVGSAGHLTKPVNAKTLVDMIHGALDKSAVQSK